MRAQNHVTGYRETMRALSMMEKDTAKAVKDGLKEAATPIAETARSLIAVYPGASLSTIKPRVTTRGVFVTQAAKKVTGVRGDYGGLQMTRGMEPALEQHGDDVKDEVIDAFNRLAIRAGF